MTRLIVGLFAAFLALVPAARAADNTVVMTPGVGVTFRSVDVGSGVQSMMHILGNSSGTSIYGTAGTANASVLTIQGIASMTPIQVTGTGTFAVQSAQNGVWTIQPGNTANTTPWLQTINQGGNSAVVTTAGADAASNTLSGLQTYSRIQCWNGTTWDRCTQVSSGAAGTASTQVLTVQGIAGMTKLLVTPDANSAVNVAQINGVTPLMGNGTTGTGSPRVTIASDNTAFTVNAAQSGTWTVQPGNTANTTPWLINLQSGTTGGCTPATASAGASTNATNVKGSAGTLCKAIALNTTSTLYYLLLYNVSGTPTCNTDTIVARYPIPQASGGIPGGVAANLSAYGEAYGTGIAFCITANADGTGNAATGVYFNYSSK